MRLPELVGAGGLGWVAANAVLIFAVAVIGLRLGEQRTLAQLGAFDFAIAVATGAIIGGTAISPSVSLISAGHPPGGAPPGRIRPAARMLSRPTWPSSTPCATAATS